MKDTFIKNISLFFFLFILLIMAVGCEKSNKKTKSSITKEEAYNIYCDTIKKFVPELIDKTSLPECDINITTRDEVTFLTEHFIRNTTVNIKSKNVDGKLQYYLLNEFPEANKINFYCINNDRFYSISCESNKKGTLEQQPSSNINSFIFPYLNTPLFPQDAISSFESKKKNSDIEVTFIVKGDGTDYGYGYRVMSEILPNLQEDKLDDIKIILTFDKDGVPKTMSTELSMSILNKSTGNLHAKKKLNMNFRFNKFDNVDFDISNIISQYALDFSCFK